MPEHTSSARVWPFVEAGKLRARAPSGAAITFETGFGASGLPHIGTFGEIVRTQMVRRAFAHIAPETPTRIICFSDDMDALRKVPENMPNQDMLAEHIGKPLSSIPDPFGTHESFAAHNNARFRHFLERFGFDCAFMSATEAYASGRFDALLQKVLTHYDAIRDLILPTLGKERRKTYSPFMPVCPRTGRVLMAEVVAHDADAGEIRYRDTETGKEHAHPITGGACKLQWKVDWAMRWCALGVDYEMAGKDLNDSFALSSRICKVLGYRPPEGFRYELFLDGEGQKISKSLGNGLSLDEWLRYAPPESLSFFMFGEPRRARKLHFDVIPRAVDAYLNAQSTLDTEDEEARLKNPVWYMDAPTGQACPVDFTQILNLVAASHADTKEALWGFIRHTTPDVAPKTHPLLDTLIGHAIAYYDDIIRPQKKMRAASASERVALEELAARFEALSAEGDARALQTATYDIGKTHGFTPLGAWFRALYEILLGQTQGPRFGSFAALYGVENTVKLIRDRLAASDI